MPHFTTYGGSHFSAGPDVYHPEFQPELNDFEIPHGPHFHGHDPVTGLDTGSGNDPIVHHVSGTAGPGGTSFFKENIHCTGYCFDGGSTENIGTTSGPGGTSFLTGYTNGTNREGMDSTTEVIDVMNNFTNFAMPVGDFI